MKLPRVFVFGSNEIGVHGTGAAKDALKLYKFPFGIGFGPGPKDPVRCFAIPTKDWNIETLPIKTVAHYIEAFIRYAKRCPEREFQVTRIGCGLAGFSDAQIAPYFICAPDNCYFDEAWKPHFQMLETGPKKYWGTF
jgi:hypothetical protein